MQYIYTDCLRLSSLKIIPIFEAVFNFEIFFQSALHVYFDWNANNSHNTVGNESCVEQAGTELCQAQTSLS